MRVLLVTNQYAPAIGGIEVFLRQLGPELQARGHTVAVLTGTHRRAQHAHHCLDGVPVFRNDIVRAIASKDPIAIARCRHAARTVAADFAPDVIHAHDCGPLLWALAGSAVPVLATIHTSLALYSAEQLPPFARQLGQCAWVSAVSRGVADEVLELAPGLAGRTSVVVNGVAVPRDLPLPPPNARRIVAVGRMAAGKGYDVLLHAFAALARSCSDVHLSIVGDGPTRPQLEQLAAQLGIADRVTLPGPVRHDAVAGVLASADVVAMPSRFEGMPLVALEAGLAGRPVVGTPVQGLADVVVNGVTGLLVPPDDPAALASALSELLDDPDRAATLGRAARSHVIAHHSLAGTASEYVALYSRVAPASRLTHVGAG